MERKRVKKICKTTPILASLTLTKYKLILSKKKTTQAYCGWIEYVAMVFSFVDSFYSFFSVCS